MRQIAAGGQRPTDGLTAHSRVDAAPAVEAALRIGFIEVMQDSCHLHALVLIELLLEHRVYAGSLIEHEILADQTAGICKSLGEPRAAGIEEQPSRLRAVRGDHNRPRLLKMFTLVDVEIRHAGAAA